MALAVLVRPNAKAVPMEYAPPVRQDSPSIVFKTIVFYANPIYSAVNTAHPTQLASTAEKDIISQLVLVWTVTHP